MNDITLSEFKSKQSIKEIVAEQGITAEELYHNTGFKDTDNKTQAINMLLAAVEPINIRSACEALGWYGKEDDYPKPNHVKIAIVDNLLQVAKQNEWNIIHNTGFFYIFNGAYWVALEDGEVKLLLRNAAIKMSYIQIICRDNVFVLSLFAQAQQDGFFIEKSYQKQSIINLKNGSLVLSMDGVKLKKFDHSDFLTHQLDFDYSYDAQNNLFFDYLNKVLPDPATRQTLQQVTGYLFVKGLKMERIFFLFGLGANGKSVFFEILSGVIGSENMSNYSLESLTDDKGYHRAMIKNKIVNFGTDIKLTRIDAGMFKTLASGEPIEARLPHRDPFMMTDYAKLIFNVNRLDSANIEHTHGFYRRLLIIPFMQTIADHEQDRDLHKKILADKAGILNWIIDGAKEVIRNRDIFVSEECENFKKQFIKETDSVAMFEEQTLKESFPAVMAYFQMVSQAYNDYRAYCTDTGYKPLGRNNFAKRMESLGFEKVKQNSGWYLKKNYHF